MKAYSNMPSLQYQDLHLFPMAVDCIIFGFNENKLELLLIHRGFEPEKGKWSLMGGFVSEGEDLKDAATRTLHKLTGLNNLFMEQVKTYGKVNRDPGGRVISTSYYALIRKDSYDEELVKAHKAQWFPLDNLPEMVFDHREMALEALKKLQQKVKTEPIGFNLLPEKFTLPQLQFLYETILGENIDKRNFRKKLMALDVLIKLEEKDKATSKKGAYLYKFDKEKYDNSIAFNL